MVSQREPMTDCTLKVGAALCLSEVTSAKLCYVQSPQVYCIYLLPKRNCRLAHIYWQETCKPRRNVKV